jgi:glutamate synthase domain-containing protein 3
VRNAREDVRIEGCLGQRFIAAGLSGVNITIDGTPGNALGAYLNGANITVNGNAQDAVGDTMNDGLIEVHGSAGDALGYAMRGGRIYVRDGSGYRTGIHMKEYADKIPVIIVGGAAGSFLGEYLAGGRIIVLGLGVSGHPPVGNFTGTGMHGGKIFIRCDEGPGSLPAQVSCEKAEAEDLDEIRADLADYAQRFALSLDEIFATPFWVLKPNTQNPYKQLYTKI